MPFGLLTHTSVGSVAGNGVTSSAIDTTGAVLLVVTLSSYVGQTRPVITDSKGNTWTALTDYAGDVVRETIFYCFPTSVGAGHTFSATQNGSYPGFSVAGFNAAGLITVDQQVGASNFSAASTTMAPGSATPGFDGELLIAAVGGDNSVTVPASVNSGFTLAEALIGSGSHFSNGLAYQIQTTATARNPTFTYGTAPAELSAAMVTFKLVGAAADNAMLVMF